MPTETVSFNSTQRRSSRLLTVCLLDYSDNSESCGRIWMKSLESTVCGNGRSLVILNTPTHGDGLHRGRPYL